MSNFTKPKRPRYEQKKRCGNVLNKARIWIRDVFERLRRLKKKKKLKTDSNVANFPQDRGKTSASEMDSKELQKRDIHPNNTHGYTGLRNQGATCYLNTVLQTLFMTEEFRKAVESSPEKDIPIVRALAQLFKDLKSRRKIVTTEEITDVLKIENVCEQQDAAKWFLRILNMVGPDMSKTFQGIMEYTTTCENPEIKQNHSIMEQIDHFFSIDISMESQPSINVESCFKSLFESVFMVKEDQLYCSICKNMMDMKTNCEMKKCPPVLVLHLKRFELDFNTMNYRKNTSKVEIPLQLLVKGDHKYDLYAVVKHEGSLRSGHYYADIKSFEDQKWYQFNDSSVKRIQNLKNLHCNKAYLLLYERTRRKQNTKRASTGPHEDYQKTPKLGRDREPINPQENQQIEHSSTKTKVPQSTAREEKDQQNLQNNRKGKVQRDKAHPSQLRRDESKADRGIRSPGPDHQSKPVLQFGEMDCRSRESKLDNESRSRKGQRDRQGHLQNTDYYLEIEVHPSLRDESRAAMLSKEGDSKSQPLIQDPVFPSSANTGSKQNKCSACNVKFEYLNEESQTQTNTYNNKTRGACFKKRLTRIILAVIVFLIILIIIGVSIYAIVK